VLEEAVQAAFRAWQQANQAIMTLSFLVAKQAFKQGCFVNFD